MSEFRRLKGKFLVEVEYEVDTDQPDYYSDETVKSMYVDGMIHEFQRAAQENDPGDTGHYNVKVSRYTDPPPQEKVTTFVYNDSSSPGPVAMRRGYPWD